MTANMAKMRMVTDNMEDLEEEEEEEELDPEDIQDPTLKKRAEKEKKLQARFEAEIKKLRLDVEDAVCFACIVDLFHSILGLYFSSDTRLLLPAFAQ
jgi:hypothetical protein